jgi:hypothetical protein
MQNAARYIKRDFRVQIVLASGGEPRALTEPYNHEPTLIGWTSDSHSLIVYLRYSAYNLLGNDRSAFQIPIIIIPAPLFHAEAKLLRGGHKVILVNARLCRVVARLVDLMFAFAAVTACDVGQLEDLTRGVCSLARFVATGDLKALDAIPSRPDRPERAQWIYPFSRNILIFVILHEHGHFRLNHHARIKAANPEFQNPPCETRAVATAVLQLSAMATS